MVFQDPFNCLHPFYRVGDQIVEAILAHDDVPKKQAEARAIEHAGGGRHPSTARALPRLPAPVLGWDASASDDRDGAGP